jgi:hypothetical protein
MGFPTQYPIFQFFYWLVNTAGVGGIFVVALLGVMVLVYGRVLGWIGSGKNANERETYAYPTSALHQANGHAQDSKTGRS